MSFPPGLIILLVGVFIATVRISLFQRSLSILAPIIAMDLKLALGIGQIKN